MTTALSYAIKYVSSMENAVRFHRDQLGSTLSLSRRIGANSKPVAPPLPCILPRRNTRLVPASWVSAFLTSRRSTRRKEVAALSSPRRPRLCTGSRSPSSKTRTARSAVSVGSALPSVASASNKRFHATHSLRSCTREPRRSAFSNEEVAIGFSR
jgi:hypothetical protein